MAFDSNFGMNQQQLPLVYQNYNPTQSSILNTPLSSVGNSIAGDSGLFSTFSNWLQGDTARLLFGGTDPSTGFQSQGIIPPTLQGLGSIFQAWSGMQNLGLAKDQLNFQRNAFNTNLANQRQAYNTALEDRIRGRTSDYAGKEEDVQAYLNKNSL